MATSIKNASITVCLTAGEMMQGALAGVMRQVTNLRDERQDRRGFNGDGWGVHVEGACGELAAAKALGLYWPGKGELQADDVGHLQVRTRSRDGYELIVHPDDPDDRAFVLVRGKAPRFTVVGWIMGRDAKNPAWWRDPAGGRPAFFVPDNELHPLNELMSR